MFCFYLLLIQAYGNNFASGPETFSPDSPYFPFSNTPRKPLPTTTAGTAVKRKREVSHSY